MEDSVVFILLRHHLCFMRHALSQKTIWKANDVKNESEYRVGIWFREKAREIIQPRKNSTHRQVCVIRSLLDF